jgi:serine/threonine-protein kinase
MAQDPLVGRVLADRFAILERIGEGGTGVVYKAKQLSVDRIIAIKVLGAHVSTDPSWVKRFHNEARAASRLDHPNTVRLIDFGQTKEGLLFIAMEFLHGRSLREVLEQEKRLPAPRALRIVSQMCQSLAEAHNQGIIHRDIKPDNVHIENRGGGDFVKVLDFSVAKLDAPDALVTRAGVVFGTPAYMSPEQGRGVPLDRRSDVYAVGIVAYEMLNGKPPFDGRIPTEVVMMHLRDRPAPLTGILPQVASIVMKALEKDPGHRQQTAEELDAECQQVLMEIAPRMTPALGVPMVASPSRPMAQVPLAPPPAAPHAEQKTMLAPAPVLPSARTVAAPGAPPPGEQKTMLAPAPVLPSVPTVAAPPKAPPPGEQKTMLAPAPVLPRAAPPPGGGHEIKTVMAQAPVRPSAPPPGGPTMLPVAAPQVPPAQPARAEQRTMAASAPAPSPQAIADGTQMLPDSQGVVAYAQERAQQVRASVSDRVQPTAPAGPLFWLAWVVIGIGAGLAYHLWTLHQAAP